MNHQSALDRNLVERYLLRELDAAEAADFEEHFFDCPICAEDVGRGTHLVANLKAVLRENTLIEMGPDDKFVDLTVEVSAAGESIDCELQPEHGEPFDVKASSANGWLHVVLPADRLSEGAWTLILRDASSGREIERRRLHITKKP